MIIFSVSLHRFENSTKVNSKVVYICELLDVNRRTDGCTTTGRLQPELFYHSTPLRLRAFGGNFPTSRLWEVPSTNGRLTCALSAPVKVDHFKAEQYFCYVGEQPSLLLKFQSILSNQATCELQFFLSSSAGTPELKIFPILGPILQKKLQV